MTRLSKQARKRNISPKRPAPKGKKTGSKTDALKLGFKERVNGLEGEQSNLFFISKIKSI